MKLDVDLTALARSAAMMQSPDFLAGFDAWVSGQTISENSTEEFKRGFISAANNSTVCQNSGEEIR